MFPLQIIRFSMINFKFISQNYNTKFFVIIVTYFLFYDNIFYIVWNLEIIMKVIETLY